ncbi:cation diffusion facilitator family transporter [Microbacterium resistens]|uniref:cation diffusion facilitator family transporter n=2 Tax=Microbacterium TaxID=33882 RepID=UPI0022F03C68|nr:cation transporter [Streptomyces sp. MS2A]
MHTERQTLILSLAGVLLVSALGIGFGIVSGSFAIAFDGMISLVDAMMSILSIRVAGLIARSLAQGPSRRFSMGFWHLEPLVLAINALTLMAIAGYALVQAVLALFDGGRTVEFGPAVLYAAITLVLTTTFAIVEHRANRRVRSALVAMDVKGWIMTGGVTAALLIAFAVGALIEGTPLAHLASYVDPAILAIVACVLMPVPFGTLRRAFSEITLATPSVLRDEAESVADRIVAEHGFRSAHVYTAQVGRSRQIEIAFLVPAGLDARTLEDWDLIRRRAVAELGDGDPNHWITVTFTTDPALV